MNSFTTRHSSLGFPSSLESPAAPLPALRVIGHSSFAFIPLLTRHATPLFTSLPGWCSLNPRALQSLPQRKPPANTNSSTTTNRIPSQQTVFPTRLKTKYAARCFVPLPNKTPQVNLTASQNPYHKTPAHHTKQLAIPPPHSGPAHPHYGISLPTVTKRRRQSI